MHKVFDGQTPNSIISMPADEIRNDCLVSVSNVLSIHMHDASTAIPTLDAIHQHTLTAQQQAAITLEASSMLVVWVDVIWKSD